MRSGASPYDATSAVSCRAVIDVASCAMAVAAMKPVGGSAVERYPVRAEQWPMAPVSGNSITPVSQQSRWAMSAAVLSHRNGALTISSERSQKLIGNADSSSSAASA